MKSEMTGVLFSHLTAEGFLFNSYRRRDISGFVEPIKYLIGNMPVYKIGKMRVYRARNVRPEDINAGKGIVKTNGIISGGFDEDNSGIAPSSCCKMQRLNRNGEQVFYIAEEKRTAINEVKLSRNNIYSIASFDIVNSINVLDFAGYTKEDNSTIVTDTVENRMQNNYGLSARQLYTEIQRFLTLLESSQRFYEVSNDICDLFKADSRIDGIRYYSFYSGHNIGIWNYRKCDFIFRGSKVERYIMMD